MGDTPGLRAPVVGVLRSLGAVPRSAPSPDGSQVTWSSNRGSRAVWSQILSRAYHGRSEHAWARQQWGVCMFNVRLGIKEATLLGGLASHLGGLHNLRSLLLAAFLLCSNSSNVPVCRPRCKPRSRRRSFDRERPTDARILWRSIPMRSPQLSLNTGQSSQRRYRQTRRAGVSPADDGTGYCPVGRLRRYSPEN